MEDMSLDFGYGVDAGKVNSSRGQEGMRIDGRFGMDADLVDGVHGVLSQCLVDLLLSKGDVTHGLFRRRGHGRLLEDEGGGIESRIQTGGVRDALEPKETTGRGMSVWHFS